MRRRGIWMGLFLAPLLGATASFADGNVILDYRDTPFRMAMPQSNAAQRATVAMALRAIATDEVIALGNDFVMLGDARGELADAGHVVFHLISAEEPVAIEPFPERPAQVIVAIIEDQSAGSFTLPQELQFTRVVDAVDIDGDGSSEVLLEANTMNMGEWHTALYAVRLEGGRQTSVVQMLPDVYVDTCETPLGEKSRIAMSISVEDGELRGVRHKQRCG